MVNLLLPTGAVLFVWLVTVIHAARAKKATWRTVALKFRDSALRAVQYLAAVGVLELVGRLEPKLNVYTDKAVYLLVASELIAGFAVLGQDGIGGGAVAQLLSSIAKGVSQQP
jgi:hypothetical protein